MESVIEDDYSVAVELRRLLTGGRPPLRVVVDPALPPGTWFVVRAPSGDEARLLSQASACG